MAEKVTNRTVELVPGKGWLKTVPVVIMGPNLPGQDYALHIHKAGCGDLKKRLYAFNQAEADAEIELGSLQAAVTYIYPPGDFGYDEATEWEGYAAEFKVFPCVILPDTDTYEPEGGN